jgi:hypothetical protein
LHAQGKIAHLPDWVKVVDRSFIAELEAS